MERLLFHAPNKKNYLPSFQTHYSEDILPFVPVRLVSKLLSTIPRELSADVVAKLNHLRSQTGRGVAAALLHTYASVL